MEVKDFTLVMFKIPLNMIYGKSEVLFYFCSASTTWGCLLLRAGASYTVKGAGGWTALERAANDEIKDFILNSTFQLKRLNLEICLKS